MTSAMHAALGAARAFESRLDATAHNVANAATPGFRSVRVTFRESPAGGPRPVWERAGGAGTGDLPGIPGGEGPSDVDLARELPERLVAERGLATSLKVLRTGDEMLGALLDLKG